jgi:hypothetical protein
MPDHDERPHEELLAWSKISPEVASSFRSQRGLRRLGKSVAEYSLREVR